MGEKITFVRKMLFLPLRGPKQHQRWSKLLLCGWFLVFLDNTYFQQGINVYKEPGDIYLLFLSTEWRLCPSWLFSQVQGITHLGPQERKVESCVILWGQLADIPMATTNIFERERTGWGGEWGCRLDRRGENIVSWSEVSSPCISPLLLSGTAPWRRIAMGFL